MKKEIEKLLAKYQASLKNSSSPIFDDYSSGYYSGQNSQIESIIEDLKEILDGGEKHEIETTYFDYAKSRMSVATWAKLYGISQVLAEAIIAEFNGANE